MGALRHVLRIVLAKEEEGYFQNSARRPMLRVMKHVYLLRSLRFPEQRYTGVTSNFEARLHTHNAGGSGHTAKYRPWRLVTSITFTDDARAEAFERYLKSASGQAFANKRLW